MFYIVFVESTPVIVSRLLIIIAICIIAYNFFINRRELIRSSVKELSIIDFIIESLQSANTSTIYEKHFEITDSIKEKYPNEQIAKYWNEFEESLVFHDESIKNTIDAHHFFNEETLCPDSYINEFYKSLPNFFVGLGVLFTFIGLVVGLFGLNIQNADTSSLKEGISAIVNGARLAFISSIIGVTASLWFTFIDKKIRNTINHRVRQLQNSIDFVYPRTNPEKSLVLIKEASESTEKHLGALSEKLGDKLQEVVRGISEDLKDGIKESLEGSIAPYMEKITQKAMNSSETAFESLVDEFLQKIGDAGESQRKAIIDVNNEIQNSLISFKENFNSQVEGLQWSIEKLNSSYHFIEENLVNKFEVAINSLSESIDTQKETEFEIKTHFQEQTQFIIETNKEIQSLYSKIESLNTIFFSLSGEIRSSFVGIANSMQMATDNLETVSETNTQSAELLNRAVKNLEAPFNLLEGEYNKMRSQVDESISTLGKKFEKILDDYFIQIENQTNHRLESWNKNTQEFSKNMVDVTTQFAYVVEKIQSKVEEK